MAFIRSTAFHPYPTPSSSSGAHSTVPFHFPTNLPQLISCCVLTPRKIDRHWKLQPADKKKWTEIKTRKRMYRTRANTFDFVACYSCFVLLCCRAAVLQPTGSCIACMQVNTLMGRGFRSIVLARSDIFCNLCFETVAYRYRTHCHHRHAADPHERENEYHGNGF